MSATSADLSGTDAFVIARGTDREARETLPEIVAKAHRPAVADLAHKEIGVNHFLTRYPHLQEVAASGRGALPAAGVVA